MKSFKTFLKEAGEAAGKKELAKIDHDEAKDYAEKSFQKYQNGSVEEHLPNFTKHFKIAKQKVQIGKTQRKDMPVIEDFQVKALQRQLVKGSLDVKKPHAPETDSSDPFPEGLKGEQAQQFILRGFHDKKLTDDKVSVKEVSIEAQDLKPIQKQIYFDKSISSTAEFGIKNSRKFLENSLMVMSSDKFIVDGHHRWASSLIIDPKLKMKGIMIDMPIKKLVELLKAYGDAIGNKRNQ